MTNYLLEELEKEAVMGDVGKELQRQIPIIDLSDSAHRQKQITEELWSAGSKHGFFQVSGHGISRENIENVFQLAEDFFSLPYEVKKQYLMKGNAGYERMSQVRPSTGVSDQKESLQITRTSVDGFLPEDTVIPTFRETLLRFERQCWALSMRILSCFAHRLGFLSDFFEIAHDPSQPTYQCTLRLLMYPPVNDITPGRWGAGAHTDFDCVTLLFQQKGGDGLQICPGKDMRSKTWTTIPARGSVITCNIGDMLMRWSDDQLKSTFHRVIPRSMASARPRYSIAFFAQANEDIMIKSKSGKYPAISAGEYLRTRMVANYAHAL